MTLNINGVSRIPKKEFVNMYQFAISSKTRLQCLLLSAAIHTLIYVSALEFGLEDGLIIPGFWVRIPEGPPENQGAGQIARLLFAIVPAPYACQIALINVCSSNPRKRLCWLTRTISKTMPDYGAGPGPAVHTLHFTECASRLPAVLILPMTACSGVPGLAP